MPRKPKQSVKDDAEGSKKAKKARQPARASRKPQDGKKASAGKKTRQTKPAPSVALKTSEGLGDPQVTETPRHPGGRPSDYKPEYAEQARKLYAAGFTDQQLADWFGIAKGTIYNWQAAHPEFLNSAKLGKDAPDDRMERSLYHRGNGYEWIEEQAVKLREESWVKGEKTVTERIEVVQVRRFVPPDTAAAVFWLKNRRGWRDRQEVTGADGAPLVPVLNINYGLPA